MNSLLVSKIKNIAVLQLNKPEKLNALTSSMVKSLATELAFYSNSSLCNLIAISKLLNNSTSKNKAFCAGGDVVEICTLAKSLNPADRIKARSFFSEEYALNHYIGTTSKPVLAIMDGITMGGGVGISVHAPFRIATENTVFSMPETKIGFIPDVGGSFFLPRLSGEIGTYLGLTGQILKGKDVFFAGLATHYIPSSRLPDLIDNLSYLETNDLNAVNSQIEEYVSTDEIRPESFNNWALGGEVGRSIDKCFKFNNMSEIVEALQTENSEWSIKTYNKLKTLSPSSLIITLALLRKGQQSSFRQCFEMENEMTSALLDNPDFHEGVDALLVRKDNNPTWSPKWDETDKFTNDFLNDTYFNRLLTPESTPATPINFMNDLDFYDYPHRSLSGLPTFADVRRVIKGHGNRDSPTEQLRSKNEVSEFFKNNWGMFDQNLVGSSYQSLSISGANRIAKIGLKEKVDFLLDEYFVEEDGLLKLKI